MSYLGSCTLSEHDTDPEEYNHRIIPGRWVAASCKERDKVYSENILTVWSGLTDLEGVYGDPCMFTEWGSHDGTTPILADLRYTAEGDPRPCEHRIYIITEATK